MKFLWVTTRPRLSCHVSCCCLLLLFAGISVHAQSAADPPDLLRTQSPAPFVHRLTLYDAAGTAIDPKAPDAKPYSPAITCGKCHPYATIGAGWHFNAARAGAPHGRPGQPWVFADAQTGTQLPLSYRPWPGTHTPAQLGLGDWDFVLTFARHFPGGGVGEGAAPANPRWALAGNFEIDCMACHSAAPQHDQAERARLAADQNFAWIPTVSLGLAQLKGTVRELPDNFDPNLPPDPTQTVAPPALTYDGTRFDANDRVFFDITRRPAEERCTFCHASRVVAPRERPLWQHDGDIHLRAGMRCSDCHRHGLDHNMVRGYEDEARLTGNPEAATLSCRGCHYGSENAAFNPRPVAGLVGRYGAPYPQHKGLPTLHLEKMTCTACHSGSLPEPGTTTTLQIQTALAHALGLATREWPANAPPTIAAPVFVRNTQGKLEPRAMLWPAGWGLLKDKQLTPLTRDLLVKTVARALGGAATPARAQPLDDARIAQGLAALQPSAQSQHATAAYLAQGLLFTLDAQGKLARAAAQATSGTQAVTWPIAHDVRPARQALGAGGCTDCHAAGSLLYHAAVTPLGPVTAATAPIEMQTFWNDEPDETRAWELAFALRPAAKVVLFILAGLLALALSAVSLQALGHVLTRHSPRKGA